MPDLASMETMCKGMARFFDSPDLADFEIVCGASQWKVHRLALSLHSTVLGRACSGGFLESEKGKLDLSEHDSEEVKAMLEFIYKLDYDAPADLDTGPELCFHIGMCVLGDKYDIQGLVQSSTEYFETVCASYVSMRSAAMAASYAYKFASATKTIQSSLVAHIVAERLFTSHTGTQEFEEVMEQYPRFAIDVALALSKKVYRK